MGYRIIYEETDKVQKEAQKNLLLTQWTVGAFLLIFLIGVSLLWEQGRQRLCSLLLPQDAITVSAVEHLSDHLKDGQPAMDAIAAFCREVLYGEEN